MWRLFITIGILLLITGTAVANGTRESTQTMKEMSVERVIELAGFSYMSSGSTQTTARLIFHGMNTNRFDNRLLLEAANFYTEMAPPVAMVFYYYLYTQKETFDEKFAHYFMVMFSDAMNQYGLAARKDDKIQLSLGDIYEYGSFVFDIGGLSKQAESAAAEFGSVEMSIYVFENLLGTIAGFVPKAEAGDHKKYATATVTTTEEYSVWANSYPEEIKQLEKAYAEMEKKIKK
jgi:hypothetical protein